MRSPHLGRRPGAARRERPPRLLLLLAMLAACAGCRGGGGSAAGTGSGGGSGGQTQKVSIAGTVTFDLVPAVAGVGPDSAHLDYAHTTQAPARGVTVQAVSASPLGGVLASTSTDEAGRYTLTVDSGTKVLIRARAEMQRATAPSWDVRVVDNTKSDSLFVLDSAEISTGTADQTLDLHAASGWDASISQYTGERAAAPFAILDVVYEAMQLVSGAAPVTAFPALVVHWSPSNVPSPGADGQPDPSTGELGTSYFADGQGIYLLGAADNDTDEYDRHVIAHEYGHYLEKAFWRSDSIGGPHTRGDQLDMRTAFSEGWGNAFSAMATNDSLYIDTEGSRQSLGFSFDVEGPKDALGQPDNPAPGWFSEQSIQETLYDLYDSVQDTPQDTLALGFGPLYAAFVNHVAGSVALTSLFPFIAGLKAELPADQASQIDPLLEYQSIAPIDDDYGAGRTNAGTPTDGTQPDQSKVLPVYKDLVVDAASPVNVCSSDAYSSSVTGSVNKLGSRAYLRFTAPADGTYAISAVTTEMPAGAYADPDMVLHQRTQLWTSDGPPNASTCSDTAPVRDPAGCSERFSQSLTAGDYVLEVYEWTNTNDHGDMYPPIGLTCFDVAVSLQ